MIDTYGEEIPDEYKIVAHMGIIDNGTNMNYYDDPFNGYDGQISIETRGSTSQSFPKKQYALETQDSDGENLNVPILGMPSENDWILHAPYSDKSLLRNFLSYELYGEMGWYSTRTRFCEVVINGDYKGLYLFMEKIKRDNNRVDISTLNPDEILDDDLTGGYILKIDKKNPDALNNLGTIYLNSKKTDKAIKFYKMAVKAEPKFAICYNNLGNAYKNIGLLNDASRNYKKAIKIKENFAVAYFNLSVVQQQMNKLNVICDV